ncbi:ABC transporter substrate-binding protein [Rhodovulum sp. DZ06]|uniref:ABC transporter substrate-binding protein n=1 Tax=Rhodovulum sp. DZ06 TaxID=3425126 RepID=UPI003D34DE8C
MKSRLSTAALAAALGLGLAVAGPAAAKTKVGLLLPYSGTYAALGGEITDGFNLALAESGGDEVVVVSADTEVKPPVGLAMARKLVLQDKVDVMVGIVSSGVLGAVRNFVDGMKVPLIVANAGNDGATGAQCSKYITRVSFSNSQVNRPMGTWMAENGVKKVYTLAPDYAAGHQQIGAFKAAFEAAGGEVVGGEFTPFGKTKDFGPYLTKAKSSGAEAVYVFYAGGEAISFVKQYGSFDMEQKLYGSGFLTSPLYVKAEGDAAVGVTTSLHYVPTLDTERNAAFIEAFKAKYGRMPSEYAVAGYDSAKVLLMAMAQGAKGREAIAGALPKISYTGPRGPLEIDPATNNVVQNVYIYETVKGADGELTQKVVGTMPAVRDAANGCTLN